MLPAVIPINQSDFLLFILLLRCVAFSDILLKTVWFGVFLVLLHAHKHADYVRAQVSLETGLYVL